MKDNKMFTNTFAISPFLLKKSVNVNKLTQTFVPPQIKE